MSASPHAAGLFATADPDWRRRLFVGGLLLVVAPPIGWPALLGYRKALVSHLFADTPAPLPPWEGALLRHAVEGWKAIGVIFGHFLPLYVVLFAVAASRGFRPDDGTVVAVLFFVTFPIFSTLSFPFACLSLAPMFVHPAEAAALLLAYTAVTFLIPAGFLQVSRTGRYRSAFCVGESLSFVRRRFRAYAAAWWWSGWISLTGHLALPLSPWGVVWACLAIVFLFNELLVLDGTAPGDGWLVRLRDDARYRPLGRVGRGPLEDGAGDVATRLDLRWFSAPLPRFLGRP